MDPIEVMKIEQCYSALMDAMKDYHKFLNFFFFKQFLLQIFPFFK